MKRAIVFACILIASSAFAMGNRSYNANKFGSKDNQRKHNVEATVPADPVPVPEPSTLILLGAGMVGIAVWGRRR